MITPMEDGRPKFAHTMAYRFVSAQTCERLLRKPYITGAALLITEAFVFEQSAILASSCPGQEIELFRVLLASEGDEKAHFKAAHDFASKFALPYADCSNTVLELLCNQSLISLGINDSFPSFLRQIEREKIEPEKAMHHVNVWAHIGAHMGMEYPVILNEWLSNGYDAPNSDMFSWKNASLALDNVILNARSYCSSNLVKDETILLFTDFYKRNYPELDSFFNLYKWS